MSTIYFTEDGTAYMQDYGFSCAKVDERSKQEEGGVDRYYIKKCVVGPNGGHFYNPWGPMSKPGDLVAFDSQSGRHFYEYVQVTEAVMMQYRAFLKSRNPSHLRNAERDYNNGPKETYTHVSR
jgi:hypothetical protein